MLLSLITLCDEDQEEHQTAVDWINAVDRGGLCGCHVSETTFQLFLEMESVVRTIYKIDAVDDVEKGGKNEWVQKVLKDDDIQFQWCLLSAEIEEAEATCLLTMLVDLYVIIRGFSYGRSIMELYKQRTKKKLQKSKALRKNLTT